MLSQLFFLALCLVFHLLYIQTLYLRIRLIRFFEIQLWCSNKNYKNKNKNKPKNSLHCKWNQPQFATSAKQALPCSGFYKLPKVPLHFPLTWLAILANQMMGFPNRLFMVHTQILLHRSRMTLQQNTQGLWDVFWVLEKIEFLNFLLPLKKVCKKMSK